MLRMKMQCENCGKDLPLDSKEAMICSFECTFCCQCAQGILKNICPNCAGNLEKRPKRIVKPIPNDQIKN